MTTQDVRCPGWLATRLLAHRNQRGPHHQGFLSDHLPMAMLAMHALDARRTQLEAYADSYKGRLDAPVRHATEPPHTYAEAIGDLSSYGALLAYFDREVATQGLRATLSRFLPHGWRHKRGGSGRPRVAPRRVGVAPTGGNKKARGGLPPRTFRLMPDNDLLSHGETPHYHRR